MVGERSAGEQPDAIANASRQTIPFSEYRVPIIMLIPSQAEPAS
jgi:hypothetical protein